MPTRSKSSSHQKHVVFVPFNEPEGNMFGTGTWSYNKISWLNNPTDYFRAWDEVYRLIKSKMPGARIAGPNTGVLYTQIQGFLAHTVANGTVPDVMTWHELSQPENIRTNVATYRRWEKAAFGGTAYDGRQLPINIDEYAFNYHTSVPGQMIQWISGIEDSKVDADIAYWNIDGNLSDSAVQANRGNGQWWLFNAYGSMSGHTVTFDPPFPGRNYSLQGVATVDESKAQARALFGGAGGASYVSFNNVPASVFGSRVHATVKEIPWTGQIGDSAQPDTVAEFDTGVVDNSVAFDFGGALPALKESSAYEIVLSPAGTGGPTSASRTQWQQSYEAEAATYAGSGYSKNGPEGTTSDVSKFYTSGQYDVGGLRTGSNGTLDFTVDVPKDGTYDLSVFANSLNTYPLIQDQGPTNVFMRFDGAAEQELFLTLGYNWVVWDHTDTKVDLTAGRHTITLAAQSLDGSKVTKGDAILDRIVLSLPSTTASTSATSLLLASGGQAVTGIGGDPGNGNTLTFTVNVQKAGTYAMRVRYSNPEQSPASHYNPDPIARHADISVNGGSAQRVLFPHTFHQDKFWDLTVRVQLDRGTNTIAFSSAELPNFDGTYASQLYPDIPLRSKWAPDIDKITVAPFSAPLD